MLTERVQRLLNSLDELVVQDGGKPFPQLQQALQTSRAAGDDAGLVDTTLEMAARLSAMATVSRSLTGQAHAESLPSPDDVLEPAIDLLDESLTAVRRLHDTKRIAFVQSRLADAFLQSRQFNRARGIFLEAYAALSLPRDLWLMFDTTQKLGDCGIELEDDADALLWYERAMDAARQIDDPFEIQVQHGKIAGALRNLKRYDEAEDHLVQASALLVKLADDAALRDKIVVHRNSFTVEALPRLINYLEDYRASIHASLGRELLSDLPSHVGDSVLGVIHSTPARSDWPVTAHLARAVSAAAGVLEELLGLAPQGSAADQSEAAALCRAGDLVRRHFGSRQDNPATLEMAARHLVHVDRSRRALAIATESGGTTLGAGPDFGPGSRHVVYLRSFIASPHLPDWEIPGWGQIDLEELLACRLDRSPLIALGNPDFERFGPGRVRTTDDNWRDVLRGLAFTAQILLVLPAMTRGTCWEIEWVLTSKLLHKSCIVMPPSSGAARDWWQANWTELKRWAAPLGVSMPDYDERGLIFRLGSEGQFDAIELHTLYDRDDLHMALLRGLLMRPNLSYDFLYAIQRSLATDTPPSTTPTPAAGAQTADSDLDAAGKVLGRLQESQRMEMSEWWRNSAQVPATPGLLLLYEGPFRLLWVEDCEDLRAWLDGCAEGRATHFTRALFHLKIIRVLTGGQTTALLEGSLRIEDMMRVRVKQLVTYRFLELPDAPLRAEAADLAWRGALRVGVPELPRALASRDHDPAEAEA
jgi:tetratricopeptide (TPR) repeat protein